MNLICRCSLVLFLSIKCKFRRSACRCSATLPQGHIAGRMGPPRVRLGCGCQVSRDYPHPQPIRAPCLPISHMMGTGTGPVHARAVVQICARVMRVAACQWVSARSALMRSEGGGHRGDIVKKGLSEVRTCLICGVNIRILILTNFLSISK